MFKIILLAFSFLLIIVFFVFLIFRARRESIKFYSVHAFLSSQPSSLVDGPKKSLLDTINEFFENDPIDEINDGGGGVGDNGDGGDDAGE